MNLEEPKQSEGGLSAKGRRSSVHPISPVVFHIDLMRFVALFESYELINLLRSPSVIQPDIALTVHTHPCISGFVGTFIGIIPQPIHQTVMLKHSCGQL